jgi:hypothetical protein
MQRLDSMSALPSFVLGAFLPSYAIVVAAVGNVIAAELSRAWAGAAMVLLVVVASTGSPPPCWCWCSAGRTAQIYRGYERDTAETGRRRSVGG